MKNRHQTFSRAAWAIFRSLYESGTFPKMEVLHDHIVEAFGSAPSLDTLKHRAAKEKWDRHRLEPQIQAAADKDIVGMFAELGMDTRARVQKIVEGINYADEMMNRVCAVIQAAGGQVDPELVVQLRDNTEKAKRLSLLFLIEANKMAGTYAPIEKKIDHTTKGQKIEPRRELSGEELDSRIKSSLARLKRTGVLSD